MELEELVILEDEASSKLTQLKMKNPIQNRLSTKQLIIYYLEINMSKLQEIVDHKKSEIQNLTINKQRRDSSINWLKFDQFVVIAEIKPKSPAAGKLRKDIDYENLSKSFASDGANAISVLTDYKYFGGDLKNISKVKQSTSLPILRKDFIVDPIQVSETYYNNADIILLIVKCLDTKSLESLLILAIRLGLQVLIEVYGQDDIQKLTSILNKLNINTNQIIIGVNNRNLDTFEIDIQHSQKIYDLLPQNYPLISMSSIFTKEDVNYLKKIGYKGVLIGEGIVKDPHLLKSVTN